MGKKPKLHWLRLVECKRRLEERLQKGVGASASAILERGLLDTEDDAEEKNVLRRHDLTAEIWISPDETIPEPMRFGDFNPRDHADQPVIRFSFSETQADNAGPRMPDMKAWAKAGLGAVVEVGGRKWVVVYVGGTAPDFHSVHIAPREAVAL